MAPASIALTCGRKARQQTPQDQYKQYKHKTLHNKLLALQPRAITQTHCGRQKPTSYHHFTLPLT
jgi:hypothetical protein